MIIFSMNLCRFFPLWLIVYIVLLFQIGSVKAVISVDFDESSMEMTDEISQYLSAVDDVLTYYNENAQVKCVRIMLHEVIPVGTCEASRFEFESAVPIRFDSTVMGRFENFRIGRVCPLLVVVRRFKPLTALTGTVYRLASSMCDHTPVLFNVFEPLRIGMRNL